MSRERGASRSFLSSLVVLPIIVTTVILMVNGNVGTGVAVAGAFSLVLECIPAELGARITEALQIPTIGIGSGAGCSGQVQVMNDLLGIFEATPKHARRYAEVGRIMREALSAYASEVRSGVFPDEEHSFH